MSAANTGPVRRRRFVPPRKQEERASARDDPWTTDKLGFILVGVIVGPHGVHGELKVRADTDFGRERLGAGAINCRHYLLRPGRRYPRPVSLVSGRKATQKNTWIARLEAVTRSEEAEHLRGSKIMVKEGDKPRMGADEFMVYELAGMRVALVEDPELIIGTVRSVITREELCVASGSGAEAAAVAADIIEIALYGEDGREPSDDSDASLVPFVKQIVPHVDIQAGLILLDPPEGLLDIARVNNKRPPTRPRGLLCAAIDRPT
jgi:16S rRNA processing protein RimM